MHVGICVKFNHSLPSEIPLNQGLIRKSLAGSLPSTVCAPATLSQTNTPSHSERLDIHHHVRL